MDSILSSVGLHTLKKQSKGEKSITVLSLFDGISCGRLALRKANIPVEVYYASEIKKSAIKVTQKHFPDTKQLGDVTMIDFSKFKGKIDLLIGGSPCVDFSSVPGGSHQGLKGEKSGLFFEYLRALKEVAPKYFFLENVVMKKSEQDKISALLGVKPIEIDSALVSFQRRRRLYWTNIPGVQLPTDRGVSFQDCMDTDFDYCKKFLLSKTDYHERMCGTQPIPAGKFNCKCKNVTHADKVGTLKRSLSFPTSLVECQHNIPEYCQFRELTTREKELAQTLPVGYLDGCSISQARDLTGDCWTVAIISHIFGFLKKALLTEGEKHD